MCIDRIGNSWLIGIFQIRGICCRRHRETFQDDWEEFRLGAGLGAGFDGVLRGELGLDLQDLGLEWTQRSGLDFLGCLVLGNLGLE